jgi:hypothetical protein
MNRVTIPLVTLVLTVATSGWARSPQPDFYQSVGAIEWSRAHAKWPTPESIVNDLRSANAQTRLAALREMGVAERFAYKAEWSSTSPSHVIGKYVLIPDQVRLIYAAIGDSAQQHLGGHLKTGPLWSVQNRPLARVRRHSFTLPQSFGARCGVM